MQDFLSFSSGGLVGFVLGLIGGGGSVLSIPLLVYVVGVKSPHVAIGTSSIAVALSALSSLIGHAHAGHVRWRCAAVFAGCGIAGAAFGSTIGKNFNGQYLLLLFGVLMIAIAWSMFRKRGGDGANFAPLSASSASRLLPRLAVYGAGTGILSGFFGIGGGFLIVPGLVAAADLPLIWAIGSSLVSVAAFGATTAINYALSDLVDWRIVLTFVAGGIIGSVAGGRVAGRLAERKQVLSQVFAAIVATTGVYILARELIRIV
jgi:uncharacterized membrane protein YfcA